MNLIEILYSFRDDGIFVWTEDKISIKLSFYLDKNISYEVRNILKEKKLDILDIMDYNQIYSEETAKRTLYYKVPLHLSLNVLSNTQKAIYMHSKFDKVAYAYNVPLFIKFQKIDIVILKKALKHLLTQHKILRMSTKDGSNYDILDAENFDIIEERLYENQIIAICKEKAQAKFELDGGKLINIEIIRIIDSNLIILNLTHHHILSDAYSLNVLISELLSLYQTLESGIVATQNVELDYFDFASYQETMLQTGLYKQFVIDLRQKLSNSKPLVLKQKRSNFNNEEGTFCFKIYSANYKKLSTLALKYSVSLYSILLASYYHILYTYSRSENFPIGITISNRPQEFAKSIGPFISILPLIPDYNVQSSFLSDIIRIHEEVMRLSANSAVNLNLLTQELNYHPEYFVKLVHLIFTMHNFGDNITSSSTNQSYEVLDIQESGEKLGISINVIEKADYLLFNVSYAKNLYETAYIESIMNAFSNFLVKMNESRLLQPVNKLNFFSENNYEDVINYSKKIDIACQLNFRVHELYEQQVLDNPDLIAVVDGRNQVTYDGLNKKSNQLAYCLEEYYQITPKDRVIFCLDRSEGMMAVMLAILKIGASYVPVDIECPDKRIEYILNDTNSKLLITSEAYYKKLSKLTDNLWKGCKIVSIEDLVTTKELLLAPKINLNSKVDGSNLAYIIYTSGTTGSPKGVMIEHKSVANYIFNVRNYISPLKQENVGFATNIAFDLSITTTLCSLCSGAKIIIYKDQLQNLDSYKEYLIKYNVDLIKITPSYLELLLDFLHETKIRKIIVGGEKLLDVTKSQLYILLNSKNICLELYDEDLPRPALVLA